MIATKLIIVGGLVALIWILIEFKRMKHKLFAIFLIALILFSYFSFTAVLKQSNSDLTTPEGVMDATKLYFSWLGSIFTNLKSLTGQVVKMDWGGNETS